MGGVVSGSDSDPGGCWMSGKQHSSDDFGQQPLGAIRGVDAPRYGAPTNVILDGIVEEESGKTPTPPPFSVRTAVIFLAVVFLLGLVLLFVTTRATPDFIKQDAAQSSFDINSWAR